MRASRLRRGEPFRLSNDSMMTLSRLAQDRYTGHQDAMMTEVHIHADFRQTLRRLRRDLEAAGLQVDLSFDLQSARQALRNPEECPCPHHGTSQCTCQYAVLLVRRPAHPPVSLVIHGHDNHLYIQTLPAGRGMSDPQAAQTVREILADLRGRAGRQVKPLRQDPS